MTMHETDIIERTASPLFATCVFDFECVESDDDLSAAPLLLMGIPDDETAEEEDDDASNSINHTLSLEDFSRTELSAITEEGLLATWTMDSSVVDGDDRYAAIKEHCSKVMDSFDEREEDRYAPFKARSLSEENDEPKESEVPAVIMPLHCNEDPLRPLNLCTGEVGRMQLSDEQELNQAIEISVDGSPQKQLDPGLKETLLAVHAEFEEHRKIQISSPSKESAEKLAVQTVEVNKVHHDSEDEKRLCNEVQERESVHGETVESPPPADQDLTLPNNEMSKEETHAVSEDSPVLLYDSPDLASSRVQEKDGPWNRVLYPVQEGEAYEDLSLIYIKACVARSRKGSSAEISLSDFKTCEASIISSVGDGASVFSTASVFSDAVSFFTYADDIVTALPGERHMKEECSNLDLQSAIADIDECISQCGTHRTATTSSSRFVAPRTITYVDTPSISQVKEDQPKDQVTRSPSSSLSCSDASLEDCSKHNMSRQFTPKCASKAWSGTASTGQETPTGDSLSQSDVSLKYIKVTPGRFNAVLHKYKHVSPGSSTSRGRERFRSYPRRSPHSQDPTKLKSPSRSRRHAKVPSSVVLSSSDKVQSPSLIDRSKRHVLFGASSVQTPLKGSDISLLSTPSPRKEGTRMLSPSTGQSSLSDMTWNTTSPLGAAIKHETPSRQSGPVLMCSSVSPISVSSNHGLKMDEDDVSSPFLESPARIVRSRCRRQTAVESEDELDSEIQSKARPAPSISNEIQQAECRMESTQPTATTGGKYWIQGFALSFLFLAVSWMTQGVLLRSARTQAKPQLDLNMEEASAHKLIKRETYVADGNATSPLPDQQHIL
jgi:hypothetical protein